MSRKRPKYRSYAQAKGRSSSSSSPYSKTEYATVVGAEELSAVFEQLGPNLSFLVYKKGIRRAGARLRTLIRSDAPLDRGGLKKSIDVKQSRSGDVRVGLMKKLPPDKPKKGSKKKLKFKKNGKVYKGIRFYYKVLDLYSVRGQPMHPWFEKSVERHKGAAIGMIIDEIEKAIASEVGKAAAYVAGGK